MHAQCRDEMLSAFKKVYGSNSFILGNELLEFEKNYAAFNHTRFCAGTGNGLDALKLALRAMNIGAGDEVIVPSNTFIATMLAVSETGATPVLVEPRTDTYNIDPSLIEKAIGKRTRAIIPVHLYGQACEMEEIIRIAKKNDLAVIEDNAQAQGAMCRGQITGSFGDANATSFYPGKNLGALGDAGAITCNDEDVYRRILRLRNYGSEKKYFHEEQGYNARLDELQAAFLNVKLHRLTEWNEERRKIAGQYSKELSGINELALPAIAEGCTSVFHLYVVRAKRRNELQEFLKSNGIDTLIHYPVPPHLQKAYNDLGYKKGDLPIAEELAGTCLSLPLYPGLEEKDISYVSDTIKRFFNA
jgi:dTDP-4-amino-4,6-dideoxygalactose transaminase